MLPRDPSPPPHAALLGARALGDGLLALVLARNLHAAGCDAVLYHTHLVELASWAPWARIEPLPEGDARRTLLDEAPAVFVGDPALCTTPAPAAQMRIVFRKADWDRTRPYLRSLERVCAGPLALTAWSDALDLQPSAQDAATPEPRRIALHPTSAQASKNWPVARWLALGARLRDAGWSPEVLLAENEAAPWRAQAGDALPVVVPGRLDAVARWLQASRACIATDSGIAHLASAVGTPTLTIFRKRSAARFWAPAWGRTAVVTAPWRLPGGGGHRLWGRLLSPRRVHAALDALRVGVP